MRCVKLVYISEVKKRRGLSRKINVGIVGLGRMGKAYAQNLAWKMKDVVLIAACSLSEEERKYASESLLITSVYNDYDLMLETPGLEAVFVVSSTDMHADQIMKALEKGLHVFSEKPLAISIEACTRVQKVADRYPHLKTAVGFVRRYDKSYMYAKQKIDEGLIGQPFLVKSQTIDKDTVTDFQITYVNKSGGIFHDYNVHDIDLTRWLLSSEFKEVHAMGGAYKHKRFAELGDADNVMTSCQLENGSMAVIIASRTAMHGHDTYTEVVGTLGSLRIGRPAGKNRVEIYDRHGARKECLDSFMERFEDAFLTMSNDFIDCIIYDRTPQCTIADATKATEAAIAFTRSFKESRSIKVKEL